MAQQIPSGQVFVVRGAGGNESENLHELEALGTVETLDQADILLRLSAKQDDPKQAWQRINKSIGSSDSVQPVLMDERGFAHYPTGEITIRFVKEPSEEQLRQFAELHGLRFQRRNEFVPSQAVFELEKPTETYIPDVLKELSDATGIESAWANTQSRYERA